MNQKKESSRETTWDMQRALVQMRGTEHAVRLLIADLEREIVDRDSYNDVGPRSTGIAIATTVNSALFCEYAIKTLHSALSDGRCFKGHLLVARHESEKKVGLYDLLEERYMSAKHGTPEDLNGLIISELRSREGCCPSGWFSDHDDVRSVLSIGSANFDDWRYGYPEKGKLTGGVPKGLFAVAKGIEVLTRRRFL